MAARVGSRSRGVAGQVVAITGGVRGIGRAIAEELSTAGARVAIGDLDGAEARAMAGALDSALGLDLDVTEELSYVTLLDRVEDELGPLDVLVSNAGVMHVGRFEDESEEAARAMLAVNVEGVIRGMRLAGRRMRERGQGHLVTIASAASKVAPPGESTYAATKHAVYGYCKGVREELRGTGVDVSVVMPVVVRTELAAGTDPGRFTQELAPSDVARAVRTLIERPRPEVFVPQSTAVLAKLLALLPPRTAAAVSRAIVPNQVEALARGGGAERAGYERERVEEQG